MVALSRCILPSGDCDDGDRSEASRFFVADSLTAVLRLIGSFLLTFVTVGFLLADVAGGVCFPAAPPDVKVAGLRNPCAWAALAARCAIFETKILD